jgi:hypothetical protein
MPNGRFMALGFPHYKKWGAKELLKFPQNMIDDDE